MRLGIVLLMAITFFGNGAEAQTRPSGNPRLEAARKAVADAEARYRTALRKVDDASVAITRSIAERESLSRTVKNAGDRLADLQQQAGAQQRQADLNQKNVTEADRARASAARDLATRKKDSLAAEKAVVEAMAAASMRFLKEPATLELASQIEDAQSQLQTESDRVEAELMKTAEYSALKRDADARDAAVKQLRADPKADPPALAAASKAWIDSRGKSETALRKACERDAKYGTAESALAAARQSHAAAHAAFKKDLPQDPTILPLKAQADEIQAQIIEAGNEVTKNERAFRAAQSAYRTSADRLNTTSTQLVETRTERDSAADSLKFNERNSIDLQRLSAACEVEVRDALRALEAAKRQLAILEQSSK